MAGSHTSDRDAVTPGRPSAGAPGEPVIVFDHVSRVYAAKKGAGVKAVDDVSLAVNRGEVFGVIGFSGAGKSTLIRMINGLEKPTSGTVTVLGQQVSHLSEAKLRPLRTRIGMVFQQFNLIRSRTVYANVAYPLEVAGGSDAAATAQLEEAGHEPWFEPLMPPAGGEIESGLFALQAGLGGLALGYVFGRLKGRRTRTETVDPSA